jgi:malate dehydrogenase (oxaloacetate-decarboxylating)(NADP+)
LLVMPNIDAANIAVSLLSASTESLPLGPMLLGLAKPLQMLVPSVTARGIVNLSAIAVGQAATVSEAA